MAHSAASLNKHKIKPFSYRANTFIYFAHLTEDFDLF